METTKEYMKTVDIKTKLSTLWVFLFLNILFKDIHQFFNEGFIDQIRSGVVNGVELSPQMMMIADINMEVMLSMVLVSRLLPRKINRWANMIVSVLGILYGLSTIQGMEGIVFIGAAVLTGGIIFWTALKWKPAGKTDSPLNLKRVIS